MDNYVAICHVIALVVAADGMIDTEERKFLEESMEDFDLSEADRQSVRDFENEGAEETVGKMPMNLKIALRDGLVQATLADGKISPYETAVVKRITELMGL